MAVESSRSWVTADPSSTEQTITDFAGAHGFSVERDGDGLTLKRGSQARMRSAGANRVDAEDLPTAGSVVFTADGVEVTLRSDHVGTVLGMGPVPAQTRERFEALFAELFAELDQQLSGAPA